MVLYEIVCVSEQLWSHRGSRENAEKKSLRFWTTGPRPEKTAPYKKIVSLVLIALIKMIPLMLMLMLMLSYCSEVSLSLLHGYIWFLLNVFFTTHLYIFLADPNM